MNCVICGQPIEEGRRQGQPPLLAKYCLKCRAERRRHARVKYTWLPEYDAYLKAHYFGGLNRRFQVLTRMVRMTGLPRWYIKRQAARLGLTMKMERRPWTQAELDRLENLVGRLSSAAIAKRLCRPESSVVNKLKRLGTSRRVRDGYTMRELELCLGEDHHKIAEWITNGWLQDRLQGTRRHNGNGNDIHRIREQDIVDFIRNHPQEINLSKVDQTWFLDLLTVLCMKNNRAPMRTTSNLRSLSVLRTAALIALPAGAVGSIGLMLRAGHRNPSRVLLILFAIWVLSLRLWPSYSQLLFLRVGPSLPVPRSMLWSWFSR